MEKQEKSYLDEPVFHQPNAQIIESNEKHLSELLVSPNNPPWNSWVAFGVWVASILFIMIVPQFFVVPYLVTQKVNLQNSSEMVEFLKSDAVAVFLQVVGTIPAHILTIILAWLVVTNYKKYPFLKTLGWEWGGFKVWHTIPILAAFFALAFALTKVFGEQDNDFMRMLRTSNATVYAVAFMATFTAPLVEEVVYRGILYSAFQRAFGVIWSVAAVTTVFASVHFIQYWGSWATLILITLLSLILTLLRVKTNSLLPCFVLHTIFNGFQSLLLVIETFFPEQFQQPENPSAFFTNLF